MKFKKLVNENTTNEFEAIELLLTMIKNKQQDLVKENLAFRDILKTIGKVNNSDIDHKQQTIASLVEDAFIGGY